MSKSRALLLVFVLLGLGVASAHAAGSGTIPTLTTTGASFTSGSWSFDPWPCNSSCYGGTVSGFNYSGYLNDTLSDGNAPFVHAKTDGYGYATRIYNNQGSGTYVWASQKVFNSNGDPAGSAQVQVCRDRGTLFPDNCVTSATFLR